MTDQTEPAESLQPGAAGTGPTAAPEGDASGGADSTAATAPGAEEQPRAGDDPGKGEEPTSGVPTAAGSPFADVPVSDYVRDGVAALLLLVSLALPWDVANRASDKIEVVLLTILSLLTLALPYLARTGVLPATWTVHTTRLVRLVANAPYVLLVAVYLVVDVVGGADPLDGWGGVGSAAALGLAGALLAAQPRQSELGPEDLDRGVTSRWLQGLLGGAGLLAVTVLLTVVLTVVGTPLGVLFVLAVIAFALFVLALVGLPTLGTWRRSEAARLTLVGLGVILAVAFVLGSGNNGLQTIESTHGGRFGLVLVPALAAVAASPAVRRAMAPAEPVVTWVRVAVNALDLVLVVAAYVAVSAVLTLANGATGAPVILAIVVGVLAAGVAFVARRSLARDAATGRPLALGGAGAVALLGIVLLVVTANRVVLGGGVEHVLLAFGLPLLVVGALTVPREVRAYFAEHRPVPATTADEAARAYVWQAPAPKPVRPAPAPAQPAYAQQPGYPQQPGGAQPGYPQPGYPQQGGYPQQPGAAQPGYAQQPAAAQPGTDGRWAPGGGAAEPDPAQQVEPERTGYAAGPGLAPDEGPATAVMPAYQDPQPGGTGPQQTAQPGYSPHGYQGGYAQQQPQGYAQQPAAQPQPSYTPPAQQPAGFTAAQAADPSTPLEVLAQIVQDAPHLRPQVAANPSTYPALLDWLGNLGDPAVDAALRSRRG
jgi:hypothetical protein